MKVLRNNRDYNIECVLFDKCNMKCDFCLESCNGNRNNDINLQYIYDLPDALAPDFFDVFREKNIKKLNLSMYGGELFMDSLSDDFFDAYRHIPLRFREILDMNDFENISITTEWVTNGVFTKYDRVEQLMNDVDGMLTTSYDPVDRFTDTTLKMWYDFFIHFKKYISMVTLTLTKGNILKLVNVGDKYFEEILNTSHICTDISYYFPLNNRYEKFLPNDDEMYRFYKWALDNHYFSINIINNLVRTIDDPNNVLSYCQCDSGTTTFRSPDNTHINAANCFDVIAKMLKTESLSDFYKKDLMQYIDPKNNKIKDKQVIGEAVRGCLTCFYNDRCQKICYMIACHQAAKMEFCPLEKAYHYIENNPSIVDAYKEWSEHYHEETMYSISYR